MRGWRRICWGSVSLLLLLAGGLWLLKALPLATPPGPLSQGQPLLLRNVQLIDVLTGTVTPAQAVWLAEGKISRITADIAADQADSQWFQVDGAGRYLVPGLADLHTHSLQLAPQLQHPLWLAAGVTTVRDMSGCMLEQDSLVACAADRQRWQQQMLTGSRSSPRYPVQSSFAINGGAEVPAEFPAYLRLQSAADATALVQHYQALGVDQLKVYEQLSLQQYQWLSQAAQAAQLPLAGHQPWLVPLTEVLAAGQRSLEHGRLFLFECARALAPYKAQPLREGLLTPAVWRQLLDSQDPILCQQKMQQMAASDSWWSPTLLTLQLGAKAMDPAFRQDDRLATVPWLLRQLWQQDAEGMVKRGQDDSGRWLQQEAFALALQQVKQAQQLGVNIIAGTDAPDSFVFTGSGLHDELALYVQAGLTPLQALQTATSNAALYLGRQHQSGRIALGYDADLLLLDANPLLDIQALRQIHGLVLAGDWYDQRRLQQLQQFTVQQAGSLRLNLLLLLQALQSPSFRQQFAD